MDREESSSDVEEYTPPQALNYSLYDMSEEVKEEPKKYTLEEAQIKLLEDMPQNV